MAAVRHVGFVDFGMTNKQYLEVFIIVLNFVGITAVVFIVRKFEYFAR